MLKVFNWYLKQTLFNDNKPQICVFNFQTTTPLYKTSKFSLPPSYNFSFCKQETQVVKTELRKKKILGFHLFYHNKRLIAHIKEVFEKS